MPSLAAGVVTTALIWPGRDGVLSRWRGLVRLAFYAFYVTIALAAAE